MPAHARLHRHPLLPVLSASLLLVACGDPAPGEGVDTPLVQDPMPEIVSAQQAIQSPEIATLDPQTMHAAEIDKVLPDAPRCRFAYTAESPPILAAAMAGDAGALGVIKIHGKLVRLTASDVPDYGALASGARFTADGLTATVVRVEDAPAGTAPRPADMTFELQQGLKVGYRGWYSCDTAP